MNARNRRLFLLLFAALAPDQLASSFQIGRRDGLRTSACRRHREFLLDPGPHTATTAASSTSTPASNRGFAFAGRPRCADMITRRYRNSREAEFEYMMYEYDYRSNNLASHDPNVSAGPFAVVKERARRTMFMLSQFIFRLKKVMRYILEKHTIYVLQLEQGKYYVGSTSHRRQRHRQHFDSSRGGSAFTRLYRPVRVCAEYRRVPRKYYLAMEAQVTSQFMLRFGINNVRGAMFSETRNYTIADLDSLTAFLGHFNDLSYAHVRSTLKESLPPVETDDGLSATKRRKRKRSRMRKKVKARKGRCFNCGKDGHYQFECPEAVILDSDDEDDENNEGGV